MRSRYLLLGGVAVLAMACHDVTSSRVLGPSSRKDILDLSLSTSGTVIDSTLITAPVTATGDTNIVSTLAPIYCPATLTKSTQGWIGPEGGSIGVSGVVLTLAAGAISEPTLFEVVVPAGNYLLTEIHAVGYESFQFAVPAKIAIALGRCLLLPATKLHAVYTKNGVLVESMGVGADRTNMRMVFTTPHLSGYVIATGREGGDTTGTGGQ